MPTYCVRRSRTVEDISLSHMLISVICTSVAYSQDTWMFLRLVAHVLKPKYHLLPWTNLSVLGRESGSRRSTRIAEKHYW